MQLPVQKWLMMVKEEINHHIHGQKLQMLI